MTPQHLDQLLRKETEYEQSKKPVFSKSNYFTGNRNADLFISNNKEQIVYYSTHPRELAALFQQRPENDSLTEWLAMSSGVIVSRQDRYLPVGIHKHDWIELVYMYSGNCTLHFAEEDVLLSEHQCLLINYNVPHSCDACGENDILINLLIQRNYLNLNFFSRFSESGFLSRFLIESMDNQNSKTGHLYFHSENSRRLPLFLTEFMCEYYENGVHSQDFMDNCITLIFLELTDVFSHDPLRSGETGRTSANVLQVLRYIQTNAADCTLAGTAAFFHMNPNYFSGWIHQKTGYTFKELVQEQKLSNAANLLKNTALPVTEAARKAGYENVSFFYKKFRERYGCLPGEFRSTNC